MGDTLGKSTENFFQILIDLFFKVASGRIYAGHFCYLIANTPFGSYRNNADKLAVIGSIHAG
jgi:hypothetical protein